MLEDLLAANSRFQRVDSIGCDLEVRILHDADEVLLAQIPDREHQVLSREVHQKFELKQRKSGMIGVRPAPFVKQA